VDFDWGLISAEDYERIRALHEPLAQLRAEAWVERAQGHKTYARGFLADADGPTVEAEGVFIMPAWARDATG
jgi:hypothetical protein